MTSAHSISSEEYILHVWQRHACGSTRVAAYVKMSVANTNLYRLRRVVVPTNRSISLFSHRGVQQRLPTSIANLLDATVASLVWSKSILADSNILG